MKSSITKNKSGWNIAKSMVIALLLTSNNLIQETNARRLDVFKYQNNNEYALNLADIHMNSHSKLHTTAALFTSLEQKLVSAQEDASDGKKESAKIKVAELKRTLMRLKQQVIREANATKKSGPNKNHSSRRITEWIRQIAKKVPEITRLERKLGMLEGLDPVLESVVKDLENVTDFSNIIQMQKKLKESKNFSQDSDKRDDMEKQIDVVVVNHNDHAPILNQNHNMDDDLIEETTKDYAKQARKLIKGDTEAKKEALRRIQIAEKEAEQKVAEAQFEAQQKIKLANEKIEKAKQAVILKKQEASRLMSQTSEQLEKEMEEANAVANRKIMKSKKKAQKIIQETTRQLDEKKEETEQLVVKKVKEAERKFDEINQLNEQRIQSIKEKAEEAERIAAEKARLAEEQLNLKNQKLVTKLGNGFQTTSQVSSKQNQEQLQNSDDEQSDDEDDSRKFNADQFIQWKQY